MRLLLAGVFLLGFFYREFLAIVRPDLLTFSGELPPDRLLCANLGRVSGFHDFPVLLELLREFRQFNPARRLKGCRSFIAALRLSLPQGLLLGLLLLLELLPACGRADHQLEQTGKAAPLFHGRIVKAHRVADHAKEGAFAGVEQAVLGELRAPELLPFGAFLKVAKRLLGIGMRWALPFAFPDGIDKRLIAVVHGLAVGCITVPQFLGLSGARFERAGLRCLQIGDMGGIGGFDFGGALFCFFAVEFPDGFPFLARLRLGRSLRRLDAVVERMKLCPPVGAANYAPGNLIVVGPPVEFVGVVRQGTACPVSGSTRLTMTWTCLWGRSVCSTMTA
jgi:hypothetical protein